LLWLRGCDKNTVFNGVIRKKANSIILIRNIKEAQNFLTGRARIRQPAEAAQRWQSMGRGHIYTRDEGREPFIFFYFVL